MLVFGKYTLVILHVRFVPVMILYLIYVGSIWIRGDFVYLENSWISIPECEDGLSIFVSSLKLCIVLTDLEFM